EAVEPDVIDQIGASAEADALRRCLKLLEREQQLCIILAFVDGLSHSEVAAHIKAPLGSVKSWIRRGLLSLRRCLEPLFPITSGSSACSPANMCLASLTRTRPTRWPRLSQSIASCGVRLLSGKNSSIRCRVLPLRPSRRPALGKPSKCG